jgi:hypothetical protein
MTLTLNAVALFGPLIYNNGCEPKTTNLYNNVVRNLEVALKYNHSMLLTQPSIPMHHQAMKYGCGVLSKRFYQTTN